VRRGIDDRESLPSLKTNSESLEACEPASLEACEPASLHPTMSMLAVS
jgi:hypothetical protein